jgi:2-keto-4-pentenoate hydratase/2-oxohepta-3-ene-1,7-dioic acid hydratase in catechol pathway
LLVRNKARQSNIFVNMSSIEDITPEPMMSFKLLSCAGEDKRIDAAILIGDMTYDVGALLGDMRYASMQAILEEWPRVGAMLAAKAGSLNGTQNGVPLASRKLVAPIPHPNAVFCAAANYQDHMLAMAKKLGQAPEPVRQDPDATPYHFLKPSRQTVVGPDCDVALPAFAKNVDWEVELVAVIGREAKEVKVDEALAFVAGYTVGNDLSVRDRAYMKRPNVPDTSLFKTDFLGMKGFDGSCPIGPVIVPADAAFDPQNLHLKLWVDDVLMQDSHTSQMLFSVAEQISYLSQRMTLYPGDIVMTGTPAGTGAEQDIFLRAGQTVTAWIEGIGELKTRIV